MLSRLLLQDLVIARLRQKKKKLTITEEAENIGNYATERTYDVSKVVFVTGAKNKMRLEKNNYRRAFRGQQASHPELEKRLCDYVKDKRQ